MVYQHKVVRDPIHGDIKIEGSIVELLKTPEVQRLYNIKQLGFAHLVFPGAHHTRLEHSLGAYNIASQISKILNLENDEHSIITCAALLHDIGHGPFSHTLERLENRVGFDKTNSRGQSPVDHGAQLRQGDLPPRATGDLNQRPLCSARVRRTAHQLWPHVRRRHKLRRGSFISMLAALPPDARNVHAPQR